MKLKIKLRKSLYDEVLADLSRPHKYAYERVGFLTCKVGNRESNSPLLLFVNYLRVSDSDYIENHFVGAKINSSAIRMAMQYSLDTGEGIFHVHQHTHSGIPFFSSTDLRSIPSLVNSFRNVTPNCFHGILLLSNNRAKSLVWIPQHNKPIKNSRIALIGNPISFLEKNYVK